MSLSDIFGEFPGRPENESMSRLSNIILQIDGQASEGGWSVERFLEGEDVDADALLHLATQRTQRMLDELGQPTSTRIQMAMLSLYIDAFTTGSRYAKRIVAEHGGELA